MIKIPSFCFRGGKREYYVTLSIISIVVGIIRARRASNHRNNYFFSSRLPKSFHTRSKGEPQIPRTVAYHYDRIARPLRLAIGSSGIYARTRFLTFLRLVCRTCVSDVYVRGGRGERPAPTVNERSNELVNEYPC